MPRLSFKSKQERDVDISECERAFEVTKFFYSWKFARIGKGRKRIKSLLLASNPNYYSDLGS